MPTMPISHLLMMLPLVCSSSLIPDVELPTTFRLKNGAEFKPRPTEFPPFQGCFEGSSYFPDQHSGTKYGISSYRIDLDLPPVQRWTRLVTDKQKDISNLLSNMKNHTNLIFGKAIFELIDDFMPLLTSTLPKPYYDELVGISQTSNISIGEITLFNLFYEFFSVCTSIVLKGADGQMYHGRNLDFGLFLGWDPKNQTWLTTEYLRPLVVNVEFIRNGQVIYEATTFAGYIGILTGLKKDKFSLTVNERFQFNGGYIGISDWILGRRNQQWMGLLTRQVMEQAESFKIAQKMLVKPNLIAPVYFIIAGNKSNEGVIITRGRSEANILNMGTNYISNEKQDWYLVQTNYDHWVSPPFFDDRRGPAITCLNKYGHKAPKKTLYRVLSTRPVLNKLTVYTTIMNVPQGTLETQLQDCKSPCWPW